MGERDTVPKAHEQSTCAGAQAMKHLSIEAFEDRTAPGGGHAVVLLRGLDRLPEPALFRLKIIDRASDRGTGERLSAGDLEPKRIRATPDGVELTVGPEITACPLLLPGTAVEIEVPAAAVKGDFLWPALEPVQHIPRRLNPFRRGKSPAGAPSSAAAPIILATPLPGTPGSASGEGPAHGVNGHGLKDKNGSDAAGVWTPANDGAGIPAAIDAWAAANKPVDQNGDVAVAQKQTIRWQPANGSAEDTPAIVNATGSEASRADPSRSGTRANGTRFLVAVAAGVLAVEAALLAVGVTRPWLEPSRRAAADAPALSVDLSSFLVLDWLRAGPRSPRGAPVAGLSPDEALTRANAHLIGGTAPRDTEEGAFWLRHYLSATAGEAVSTRALTQLGSAYAEPSSGRPDYEKARHLWEVAAALGDPLAMCFLGTLHTRGLGVAADAAVGGNWLERARRAGGCHGTGGVDER